MRAGLAVVVGLVIGAVGALTAERLLIGGGPAPSPEPTTLPTPPPPTLPPAMCEGLVQLSLRGTTIVANPDRVCLAVGRPLTWEIVDSGTVTIDFELVGGNKGPFPEDPNVVNDDGSLINKDRGIYLAKHTSATGPLNVKTRGADDLARPWKYTINWTLPDGTKLTALDPVVCIRK